MNSKGRARLRSGEPLPAALLYRRCDPAELPFDLCSELADAPGRSARSGRSRRCGSRMRMRARATTSMPSAPAAPAGTSWSKSCCAKRRRPRPTPPDWCYVNNFDDPQQPRCLYLPPGRGAGFAAAMKRLVEELRAALPAAFERDEYRARREVVEQQFKQRSEEAFGAVQQRAEAKNITLMRTPTGLALAPKRDGKVMNPEAFEALPAGRAQAHPARDRDDPGRARRRSMRQVPQWEREHRDAMRELNRETTGFVDRPTDRRSCAPVTATCPRCSSTSTRSSATSRKTSTISCPSRRRAATEPEAPPVPAPGSPPRSRTRGFAAIRSTSSSTMAGGRARRSSTRTTRRTRPWSAGSSTWRASARWSPISTCCRRARCTAPMAAIWSSTRKSC